MQNEVIVTNNSPRTFKDAYHGIEYIIEPGEKKAMSLSAASHIFGYNRKDKTECYRRKGFSNAEQGEAFFGNFGIEVATYVRQDEAGELGDLKALLSEAEQKNAALTEELEAARTEIAQLKEQGGGKKEKKK